MHQQTPSQQQGFGLLVFVIVIAIVAFSLVLGYSSIMVRQQHNSLAASQKAYLAESVALVAKAWRFSAYAIDHTGANATTAQDVLTLSGARMRYGVRAVLSRPLIDMTSNTSYRNFVMYLPTPDDEASPFDEASFVSTGEVAACTGAGCDERLLATFSSLHVERELAAETSARLDRIAAKAQAYFRARMSQDPERNISVNYFRRPSGSCVVGPLDLGCLDAYESLTEAAAGGGVAATRVAQILGLGSQELLNGWGLPMEASNLLESSTAEPPFTMAFRTRTPTGAVLKILAIQAL